MIRKESLAVSRETFASERKGILADAEESLRPHIKEALARVGLGSWEQQIVAAALDVFDMTARENTEGGSQSLDDLRDLFAKELGEALEKTGKASDQAKQLETMTRWVAMMSHNAAMEAATSSDPDGNVGLEWVTMSDGDVRDSHRDADGQQVPTGSPFTVGDVELMYPGQPVGDPSVWINCRCVARATYLNALAVDSDAWTHQSDFGARSNPTTTDASFGRQAKTAADTASGRSRDSEHSKPIAGPGLNATATSPAADSTISATPKLSPKAGVKAESASTGSASTPTTSPQLHPSSRPSAASSLPSAGTTATGSRPTAPKATPTTSGTPAGARGVTAPASESAASVNASAPTPNGPRAPGAPSAATTGGSPRPTMLGELAAGTITANVSRETFSAPGLKKDGTPPVCKFCDQPSTGYVLHSEGMAYVPFCAEHEEDAKAAAAQSTPGGQPDPGNIDKVAAYAALSDVSRETETEETPMEDNSGPSTSSVIVALPEASDPLSAASSEKDGAHCTLLWFGDAAALDEVALKEAIQQFIDHGQVTPVTDTVSGRATLGKDKADVVLLDAPNLLAIRSGLLEQNNLLQANESVDQHPTWLPHVTLGYPTTPAAGEYASEPGTPVTFDRLALWHGESRTEFVLGASAAESPTVDDGAAALAALGTLVASAGVDVSRETEDEEPETDWDEEMKSLDGAEEFAEVPWYGVLTVEGVTTGDGRKFAEGSLTHRPLPMPLKFMWEDDEGHKGSYPIARIDRIFRDGNLIKAEGVFDTSEQAYEGVRLLANDIMRGVSVDLDSASLVQGGTEGDVMEFATGRISSATICSIPAFAEAFVAIGTWADAGGDVSRETSEEIEESTTAPTPPADAKRTAPTPKEAVASDVSRETFDIVPPKTMDGPGWVTDPKPTHKITSYWVDGRGAAKIGWGVPGDFNRCRAQLGKYVQNPAWLAGLCANLHYRALGAWPGKAGAVTTEMNVPIGPAASLVASAAPEVISADFFRNPELDGPTPVTRGENGHIFGHLAEWGTCHIAYEVCTTVPPSSTEYAYFLTGQVFTDVGSVAVGQLTVGGGHADPKLGVRAAMAHYDNVSSAVADVTVGEDAYGVWFSGRIRPWATERQIHELFAAGPSGDWRGVRSRGRDSMELVAAHAVNVQGFPVARTRFAIEGGRQVSLVAAGMPDRNKLAEANELLAEIRAAEFSMLTTTLTTLEGK